MGETPPKDVIPSNGFVMELPGMSSPHIDKVGGIGFSTGSTSVTDGGTNITYKFSDGVYNAKQLTFSRPRDGSPDDAAFQKFFDDMVKTGKKVNGTVIQYRFGQAVLKIQFKGLLCNDFSLTDLEGGSSNRSEQQYQAEVDYLNIKYNEQARQ